MSCIVLGDERVAHGFGTRPKVYRGIVGDGSFNNKSAALKSIARNCAPRVELAIPRGGTTSFPGSVVVEMFNHVTDSLQVVEAIRLEAAIKFEYQRLGVRLYDINFRQGQYRGSIQPKPNDEVLPKVFRLESCFIAFEKLLQGAMR
ncbi:hypothetical protein CC_3429 [Caulobacter vibrioides CB15]|uniref:Uncharacterized protein n=1 Tax=Caulobacter vibrioides (strain ATCC 19089 / CIP 103742 / CB 15) TaxID=190650 RepID=Q9A2X7_CAUVC|nr:hypothetical protein CC_3429 [Caulobacter vibrioides CB15]